MKGAFQYKDKLRRFSVKMLRNIRKGVYIGLKTEGPKTRNLNLFFCKQDAVSCKFIFIHAVYDGFRESRAVTFFFFRIAWNMSRYDIIR